MTDFFQGIAAVARETARERGPFTLFAVMHRTDTPEWWDVVVSAPWLDTEGMGDYRYLTARLKKFFSWDLVPRISHVAILEEDNPVVLGLLASRDLEPGRLCLVIGSAGPVDFDKGYLIERRQPSNGRANRGRANGKSRKKTTTRRPARPVHPSPS